MALRLNTGRSLISKKFAGAFFAVLALFVQPLVILNVPQALAVTPLTVTPSSFTIEGANPNITKVSSVDATGHQDLKLSFAYNAENLDNNEALIYGWRAVGGTDSALSNIQGSDENANSPVGDETGQVTDLPIPAGANNKPIEVYFTNTGKTATNGGTSDAVQITNIYVTGDVIVPVDITAPAVPGLVKPTHTSVIHKNDAIFDWNDVTDPSEPVTYEYQSSHSSATGLNNALSNTIYHTNTGTTSQIDATASEDNTYYWQVRACDAAANCSNWSGPWEITIDSKNPIVELTPSSNGLTNQDVAVNRKVSDQNLTFYTYCVKRDGTETTNCTEKHTGEVSDSITYTAEGEYEITLKAWDEANNTTEENVFFEIDKTPPKLSIPTAVQNINDGTYTLSVISDDKAETSIVNFALDGATPTSGTWRDNGDGNTVTWSFVTGILIAGSKHSFTASATDAAGNPSELVQYLFTVPAVQTDGPAITGQDTIDSPFDNPGPTLVAETDANEDDATDVLGAEDESDVLGTDDDATDDVAAIAPSEEGWQIWGVAWYWWVLALAGVGSAAWWAFIGRTRHADDIL